MRYTVCSLDLQYPMHQVGRMVGHTQEVCGLTWAKDGRTLASGGNDNCVQLWDWQVSTFP